MMESSFLNPSKAVRAAGIHEGMRVADFGAGSGFFTRAAAREVGDGGVVWAVDIQQPMLIKVKTLAVGEGLSNVEVVRGDVEHLGGTQLPDGSFDAVIIANVLFSAEHRDLLAREAARVLRRGGIVLAIDWKDSFGGLGPHKDHVCTADAAAALFAAEGFVGEREVPAGAYHWGLVFRKKAAHAAQ